MGRIDALFFVVLILFLFSIFLATTDGRKNRRKLQKIPLTESTKYKNFGQQIVLKDKLSISGTKHTPFVNQENLLLHCSWKYSKAAFARGLDEDENLPLYHFWYHNGSSMHVDRVDYPKGHNYDFTVDSGTFDLTLMRIKPSDAGSYACRIVIFKTDGLIGPPHKMKPSSFRQQLWINHTVSIKGGWLKYKESLCGDTSLQIKKLTNINLDECQIKCVNYKSQYVQRRICTGVQYLRRQRECWLVNGALNYVKHDTNWNCYLRVDVGPQGAGNTTTILEPEGLDDPIEGQPGCSSRVTSSIIAANLIQALIFFIFFNLIQAL